MTAPTMAATMRGDVDPGRPVVVRSAGANNEPADDCADDPGDEAADHA